MSCHVFLKGLHAALLSFCRGGTSPCPLERKGERKEGQKGAPAKTYIKCSIARTWELRNEKFQVEMKKEGQMEGSACRH